MAQAFQTYGSYGNYENYENYETRETYDSYESEYGREHVYPMERMYVHPNVYLPDSEIDPRTRLLKPDVRRPGRMQAKRLEYDYLDKEYKQLDAALKAREEVPGPRISLRTAILVVVIFVVVTGLLSLSLQGRLTQRQKTLNRMNREVEQNQKINDEIAAKIAEASDATTVCYIAARDLDMIPAEAANAIHLVAMDTRPTQPGQIEVSANNGGQDGSPVDSSSGGQPNVQETAVPAVASAGTGN